MRNKLFKDKLHLSVLFAACYWLLQCLGSAFFTELKVSSAKGGSISKTTGYNVNSIIILK